MTWKIQAITGELTGQEISIDRDMLVGRHQTADIVLQQSEISRKHAAFLLVEQALYIQDLKSSNGTFVNDVQVEDQLPLKEGDIVQFASLKFSVLAPAKAVEIVEPVAVDVPVQPAEAVAVSETAQQVEEVPKTAAQQMNDQGMPDLKERDAQVKLSRDGMPQNISVPKPAPIPEGVDLSAVKPEPTAVPVAQAVTRVEEEQQVQKNASLGLISLVVLIVLAIVAWLFFK